MTARERFEKANAHLDLDRSTIDGRYQCVETRRAEDSWNECEAQFHPPSPTNLPNEWKIKGEEPRMIKTGEMLPKNYEAFGIVYNGMFSVNLQTRFVWELERVESV